MQAFHPLDKEIDLRFKDVSFSYDKQKVLEGINFHIHRGEFIALAGPNGSGKTTLLRLILGLLEVQKGSIEILGRSPRSARENIGYVPQQPSYDRAFPISVREVVKMGRVRGLSRKYGTEDRAALEDALAQTELSSLADRSYAALSGGQRRRVLVARALACRPRILILDEPTANMDRESEERLFSTLGKIKGTATILIVTHNMEFVSSLTDRVLCLGNEGNPGTTKGIVQHRTASAEHAEADTPSGTNSRIIHSESIPADACFKEDTESTTSP